MKPIDGKAIILALHFEFKGDFDKMFAFIQAHEDATPFLEKWETKINRELDNYAWFYDEEYPEELKSCVRPPLIVKKKNIKSYKFRFVSYVDVEVSSDCYKRAKAMAAEEFLEQGPDFETTKIIHKRK